ncbi:MAG: hypothetical protein ACJAXA_001164 [Candidatus Aldehydirespiratoraceae bacterium]|jgi:hypothetical protein
MTPFVNAHCESKPTTATSSRLRNTRSVRVARSLDLLERGVGGFTALHSSGSRDGDNIPSLLRAGLEFNQVVWQTIEHDGQQPGRSRS